MLILKLSSSKKKKKPVCVYCRSKWDTKASYIKNGFFNLSSVVERTNMSSFMVPANVIFEVIRQNSISIPQQNQQNQQFQFQLPPTTSIFAMFPSRIMMPPNRHQSNRISRSNRIHSNQNNINPNPNNTNLPTNNPTINNNPNNTNLSTNNPTINNNHNGNPTANQQ